LKKKKKDGTSDYNPEPPKMSVAPMDQDGNFKIGMSKPMMAPEGELD